LIVGRSDVGEQRAERNLRKSVERRKRTGERKRQDKKRKIIEI